MLRPNPTPQCRCADPAPFAGGRRLLPVYEAEPTALLQVEVAAYCSSCFYVIEPDGTGYRVTEAQVRFDLKSQARILIGAESDWETLGLHDWHALKRYGVAPIKTRREVAGFDEEHRRQWMLEKLGLGDGIDKRTITDVFGRPVSVNARIVVKTLTDAPRTPWVMHAMLPLAHAAEVWENDHNNKGELRRYYLTPFRGEDPHSSGIVAVSAKDDLTGEDVVFNVVPITSSYANNIRKGRLLFVSYPEEALCHHGCCSDNVNGFAERAKLIVRIKERDAELLKVRTSVKGLQQEVAALRDARIRQRIALTQMQTLVGALITDFEPNVELGPVQEAHAKNDPPAG
jgi:hypothetical protein